MLLSQNACREISHDLAFVEQFLDCYRGKTVARSAPYRQDYVVSYTTKLSLNDRLLSRNYHQSLSCDIYGQMSLFSLQEVAFVTMGVLREKLRWIAKHILFAITLCAVCSFISCTVVHKKQLEETFFYSSIDQEACAKYQD